MRKSKNIFLLISLLLSFRGLAQKKKYDGAGAVSEFLMPAQASIVGHFDLFYEAKVPNSKGEKRAFWYKIVFSKDCSFKFNLFPLTETDRYDFRLFKVEGNINFCEALAIQSVFYIPEARTTRTWNDSDQTKAFRDNLIYTKTVNVKKGDAIYIEIINLWGEDKGHIIDLTTCDYSYVLKAEKENSLENKGDTTGLPAMRENWDSDAQEIKESAQRIRNTLCPPDGVPLPLSSIHFNNEGAEVKSRYSSDGNVLFSPPKKQEDKRTAAGSVVGSPTVTVIKILDAVVREYKTAKINIIDSAGQPVDAKPKITEELKGRDIIIKTTGKTGEYDIVFEAGKKHKVICNPVGYKSFDQTMDFDKLIAGAKAPVIYLKLISYETGQKFILKNIAFHPNTPVIRTESKKEMDNLYKYLKSHPAAVIEISGHTNGNRFIKPDINKKNLGNEWVFKGSCRKLSVYRAEKVKEYLVKQGIESKRLKVKGYGGDRPLYADASNQEEVGKNIRVEILLLKK